MIRYLYPLIPLPCYICNLAYGLHTSTFIATFVTSNVTTMNARLKQFLAAENISQAQFADTIKVVRASVSHVLAGRNNPSYDFIKAIMDNYPALNIEWLILGKGKMYKEIAAAPPQEKTNSGNFESELLFDVFTEDQADLVPEESDIPVIPIDITPNIVTSSEINTAGTATQVAVKQRKVSKIIVLFDDGSFQEM